jgi:hypothetical protein
VTKSSGIMVGCSSAFYRAERGPRAVGNEADEAFPANFSWKRRGWGT